MTNIRNLLELKGRENMRVHSNYFPSIVQLLTLAIALKGLYFAVSLISFFGCDNNNACE